MTGSLEWIFFDVGSTLVDESRAFRHRIEDAIAGTRITYRQFTDTMMAYYRQNKKGDLETIREYGLIQTAWHAEDEALYPDAKQCLAALHAKYGIGIIANQALGTADRLRAFGILEDIDLVAASAEEGISKPDPRLFEIALEGAGCPPQNAAMVGDRLDNDIAPAKALEMKTVWVRRGFGQYSAPRTEMERADHVASDLDEVCRILMG